MLAEIAQHDIFVSAFTAVGMFTYDPALVAFNLRYEVRIRGENPSLFTQEQARRQAVEFLAEEGFSHRIIRVKVMDMADLWSSGVRQQGAT